MQETNLLLTCHEVLGLRLHSSNSLTQKWDDESRNPEPMTLKLYISIIEPFIQLDNSVNDNTASIRISRESGRSLHLLNPLRI